MVGQVLLMHALGTADSDFASGLISQLAHLNRDEGGVVNYHGLNFMFSVIKGLAPRDQLEAMLAAQMAAVHVNAINIAKVLTESLDSVERESMERSLNKLSRTFISQMESLKRYRASGPQMVQNVSVAEGGQAIVANLGQPPMEGASSVVSVAGATNVVPLEAREVCRGYRRVGTKKLSGHHRRNTAPMLNSQRCGARTRSGRACNSPAVRGKRRCRMHGGARGSGAPRGNKNALKLGLHTREAIAGRKALRNLLDESRKLMIRLATSREGNRDPEPDG